MDSILDRYLDEALLTEQEAAEVQKIVSGYKGIDMNLFVQMIGGPEKIDRMNKINEVLDNEYANKRFAHRKPYTSKENLDEWKKGFMEGFEEAYKRLNSGK